MHLTRVNGSPSGTVGQAAAIGGDADLLSLLLGGDSAAAAPAFPAMLENAIGDGVGPEAAGEDGVADAVDVLAGTDGTDGEGSDAGAATIAAALAAALALGGVVTPAADAVKGTVNGTATTLTCGEGGGGRRTPTDAGAVALARSANLPNLAHVERDWSGLSAVGVRALLECERLAWHGWPGLLFDDALRQAYRERFGDFRGPDMLPGDRLPMFPWSSHSSA